MTPKEIGTVAVNVAVVLGAFGLVGFGVITFPAALAGIGCLVVPSAAPILYPKLLEALTTAAPPRGSSVLEDDGKDGRS